MAAESGSGRRVLSNSLIYTVCGLLQKCFSFFLLPLYTAYLTTADYGITSIAVSFANTMGYVAAFSLYAAVARFYVELKDDPERLGRFYGTMVCFVALSAAAFAAVLGALRGLLTRYVFVGVAFFPIVAVCLISLIFSCLHTVHSNILRSQQRAMESSVLSLAYFFVTLGFNIWFVVGLRLGALGVVLATLASSVLYTVYFLWDMLRKRTIRLCIDGKLLKEALRYSVPIMPHNLSSQIAVLVSKVLIGGTDTLAELGLYSVAAQFGTLADTVQSYVDSAYGPWLYEKLHAREQGFRRSIASVSGLLSAVIGLMMLGIALFAQDYILLFMDESYASAWHYVPLIVLVYAVKTMYYFYVEVLFYYKKASRLLFTATLTGSILNVLLSAVLIPRFGVYGSIGADAAAMTVRVGIVVVLSHRFDDVGLKLRTFVGNLLTVAGFILAGLAPSLLWLGDRFSVGNFVYKAAVVLLYVLTQCAVHRAALGPALRAVGKRLRR